MILLIIFLVVLLLLSALLAGSETALFLVAQNRVFLKKEENRSGKNSLILKMLNQPSRLLMTILLGNLGVNLVFFAFSSVIIFEIQKEVSSLASVGVSVVFLLLVIIFGEILPKIIASSIPYSFSRLCSPFIYHFLRALCPVTSILESTIGGLNRLLGLDQKQGLTKNTDDLQELVDVSEDSGSLDNVSADIIENILGLHDILLKEICIPRVDVKSCRLGQSPSEILKLAREWGLKTIPLYREHVDDMEHFIQITDIYCSDKNSSAESMSKPLAIMPEMAPMDWVLQQFVERSLIVALVVDEHGAMQGIATWSDVMQVLNEKESTQDPYKKVFEGRQKLRELELFEDDDGEQTTLNGYLLSHFDGVPKNGDCVEVGQNKFLILEATEKGVEKLVILKPEEQK